MTSIIHLYGALGALNHGLRSRLLCTGVNCTKSSLKLVQALYKHGLVSHFHFPNDPLVAKRNKNNKQLRIFDKKVRKLPLVKRRILVFFRWSLFDKGLQLKVRSTPGHRKYITHERICKLLERRSETFFLSTSIGIISAQEAYNLSIGGELLFSVRF